MMDVGREIRIRAGEPTRCGEPRPPAGTRAVARGRPQESGGTRVQVRPVPATFLLCALLGSAAACESSAPVGGPTTHLDQVVDWEGVLTLEERDDALVAGPVLRLDPDGGWLYWDVVVPQARRYALDGTLLQVLGGVGGGPGEYEALQGLVRLEDSRLATVDRDGRVQLWSPIDGSLVKDFSTGLVSVLGAAAWEGGLLLRTVGAGRAVPDPVDQPWAHLLDVDREEIVESFFHPPLTAENVSLSLTVRPGPPRVLRDTLYLAMPLFDTVWAFPAGAPDRTGIPIPVGSRLIAANRLPPSPSDGMPGLRAWIGASWFVEDVFPLREGRRLVSLWTYREETPRRALVLLDRDDEPLWEVETLLRLQDVDHLDRLYFWDPEGMEPARIRIGTIR